MARGEASLAFRLGRNLHPEGYVHTDQFSPFDGDEVQAVGGRDSLSGESLGASWWSI